MNDKKSDGAYLRQGLKRIATDSSVLVSSSRYLNNGMLRDWVSTHLLRRNGPDRPLPTDNAQLVGALSKIRDNDAVEEMFERERRINPQLDAWLTERFMSTYTLEDLKPLPPASVGGLMYRFITEENAQLDIIPRGTPTSHFDYYTRRHLQTHDLVHIVCGGLFDSLGEVVPHWVALSNIFKHVSAELASELTVKLLFNSLRVISRSLLHYPETFPVVMECIAQGIAVGEASEPIFMMKYEHVLHLTPEAAREELGVRKARDVDTTAVIDKFFELA